MKTRKAGLKDVDIFNNKILSMGLIGTPWGLGDGSDQVETTSTETRRVFSASRFFRGSSSSRATPDELFDFRVVVLCAEHPDLG